MKMKEKLINGYLRIEPVEQDSFMASEKTSYEEIGRVIAVADSIDIPVGATVFFDSFMAKKYPAKEFGKFEWYIHIDEIVKYEYEPEVSE